MPIGNQTFGATRIEAYRVADADQPAWLGAERAEPSHTVLTNGRIKLTNDTRYAEWVIEGHGANLTARQLLDQSMEDVAQVYGIRDELKAYLDAAQRHNQKTVLAPDGTGDLRTPGPQGLFVYRPDANTAGMAQITAQYANPATIRRINQLNASKFLTGTKVLAGQDANRVAGAPGFWENRADAAGTTSSATAAALLADFVGNSAAIMRQAGGIALTAEQVGLVKLMVVNDAMASTISRHHGLAGEAQEKNMQRFFPKSRRNLYVDAVAQADIGVPTLNALRQVIIAAQAAMAQAVWDRADPFALNIQESIKARATAATAAATAAPATAAAALAAALAAPAPPAAAAAAAAAAAPAPVAITPATVAAAIGGIGNAVAVDVMAEANAADLIDATAGAIVNAQGIAAPAARAIARVLVEAAVAAKDGVTAIALALTTTQQHNALGQATTLVEQNAIKDLVLGANGGVLAGWIGRAALAYTDSSLGADDHRAADGTGNVIHSDHGFTPVAAGERGAVYEFREREVPVAKGNTDGLKATLTSLFGAAD